MPKNIDGKPNNKVIELMARNKTKAIGYLLALLVKLVLIDIVAIDELVVQVDLPALLKHHWVFDFEGKFMFDLDIADCKGVLELELWGFYHIFGALQHKADLELLGVEQ